MPQWFSCFNCGYAVRFGTLSFGIKSSRSLACKVKGRGRKFFLVSANGYHPVTCWQKTWYLVLVGVDTYSVCGFAFDTHNASAKTTIYGISQDCV